MSFLNVIYFIAFLIPKKKGLWLFSSWFGGKYLDNPKYIFQELLKKDNDVCPYWVVKDKVLLRKLKTLNIPVVYAFSFKGFWLQLRSEAIVFTHSVRSEFISWLISAQTKRVQTWHGIPIKKIGFDNQISNTNKNKIINYLVPFLKEEYDLITAVSEEDKKTYHSAFGTPLEKIKITGYPRNDEIFRSSINDKKRDDEKLKIIYMPTLRGKMNDEFKLLTSTDFDFNEIDDQLDSLNAVLYIKLHPVQVFSQYDSKLIKGTRNIKALINIDDIYESIGEYDALITDYSGIFFDFMITGKPIIMAPVDYNYYIENDREVYYDYDSICPTPPCHNWKEIMISIELLNQEKNLENNYSQIQKRFHRHYDANSSARAIREIEKISRI